MKITRFNSLPTDGLLIMKDENNNTVSVSKPCIAQINLTKPETGNFEILFPSIQLTVTVDPFVGLFVNDVDFTETVSFDDILNALSPLFNVEGGGSGATPDLNDVLLVGNKSALDIKLTDDAESVGVIIEQSVSSVTATDNLRRTKLITTGLATDTGVSTVKRLNMGDCDPANDTDVYLPRQGNIAATLQSIDDGDEALTVQSVGDDRKATLNQFGVRMEDISSASILNIYKQGSVIADENTAFYPNRTGIVQYENEKIVDANIDTSAAVYTIVECGLYMVTTSAPGDDIKIDTDLVPNGTTVTIINMSTHPIPVTNVGVNQFIGALEIGDSGGAAIIKNINGVFVWFQ